MKAHYQRKKLGEIKWQPNNFSRQK
jgi:hypothetical protein